MRYLLYFILCGGWIVIGFLAMILGVIHSDNKTIYMGASMVGFAAVCLAAIVPKSMPKKAKANLKSRK